MPAKEPEAAIRKFAGKIQQVVPRKAAVKRALREREIYYFDILEVEGKGVLFRMGCEAGTYIRKLCHDLNKELKPRQQRLATNLRMQSIRQVSARIWHNCTAPRQGRSPTLTT